MGLTRLTCWAGLSMSAWDCWPNVNRCRIANIASPDVPFASKVIWALSAKRSFTLACYQITGNGVIMIGTSCAFWMTLFSSSISEFWGPWMFTILTVCLLPQQWGPLWVPNNRPFSMHQSYVTGFASRIRNLSLYRSISVLRYSFQVAEKGSGIRGTVHDIFPRFWGFGFLRKPMCTETLRHRKSRRIH